MWTLSYKVTKKKKSWDSAIWRKKKAKVGDTAKVYKIMKIK